MESKKKTKFMRTYNIVIAALGALMLLYYISCGLSLNFAVSGLWVWLIAGLYCLVKGLLRVRCIDRGVTPHKALKVLGYIWISFVYLLVALFVVFETAVIGTALKKPEPDLDYIIVLGAKVNGTKPSKTLSNRIRAAYDYLSENPGTKAVLSGGKGRDEGISEAQCMINELTSMGIAPERLIPEDRSTSTLENIKFSRELIPEDDCTIGIVTANYHMFRALQLVKKYFGKSASAVVAYRDNWFWLPHYFVREFIADAAGKLGWIETLSHAAIRL